MRWDGDGDDGADDGDGVDDDLGDAWRDGDDDGGDSPLRVTFTVRIGLVQGERRTKLAADSLFTPFTAGRHVCLGEDYAYMQIKVIWSYLLRNFELKMISPLIPGR